MRKTEQHIGYGSMLWGGGTRISFSINEPSLISIEERTCPFFNGVKGGVW